MPCLSTAGRGLTSKRTPSPSPPCDGQFHRLARCGIRSKRSHRRRSLRASPASTSHADVRAAAERCIGTGYRSRPRTEELAWFACARAAMPAWLRMLNCVMFADSSAMFASRMRLSAACVLTTCDGARLMANVQPVLQRADRVLHVAERADRGLDLRQRRLRLRHRGERQLRDAEVGRSRRPTCVPADRAVAGRDEHRERRAGGRQAGDRRFTVDFRGQRVELGRQLGDVAPRRRPRPPGSPASPSGRARSRCWPARCP